MEQDDHLIYADNLTMYFPVMAGVFKKKVGDVKAVDEITFHVNRGETLGLVGESGCGKTTTGRCLLQMYEITRGRVWFEGIDLTQLKGEELRQMRRNMQMIFQDPYASLDPRMTAGDIIGEPLRVHNLARGKEYRERIAGLLRLVELEPRMAARYPHEFSGGQRQRIGIARALAMSPKFVVCDEAVSALDVSIQAQIIKLLMRLKKELNLTYLFIAHDLSVVRHMSDRMVVMYLGKIVEIAEGGEIYDNPLHPYTKALISAVPIPDPIKERQRNRIVLEGDVPSPVNPPRGCRFHPRCSQADGSCTEGVPELRDSGGGHWVACHIV